MSSPAPSNAQEHRLAPEAIGHRPPERGREEEGDTGRAAGEARPGGDLAFIGNAEFLDVEGNEGENEVRAHEADEDTDPDEEQIPLPRP